MKLTLRILIAGLATQTILASNWFSKTVYNKWHETELERWLSDNGIPYPSAADRKDLEKLVADNWKSRVSEPYLDWDPKQLNAYLKQRRLEATDATTDTKESLLNRVKSNWYESEDKAEDAWTSIKDWIFDSWSDNALLSFANTHGIQVSQPQKRDSILEALRTNYEMVANKIGETAEYPGNWLYELWSESELKEWLDSHGVPVPQPTSRDALIASVRRNSRIASHKAIDIHDTAATYGDSAKQTVKQFFFKDWSDSKLKEFLEKNGVSVPQGCKTAELHALTNKNRAQFSDDAISSFSKNFLSQASDSEASAFGAATSKAGNQFAKATDAASGGIEDAFNVASGTWSESRLKAYLDSRGVPTPQNSKRDELLAAVRLHRHKAANGWSTWTFDTWTTDNLKTYLASFGNKAAKDTAKKADATREQLLSAAQDAYATASKSSGSSYASVTSYLAQQTDAAKDSAFDTWSESELKSYLDSYGVSVPQGSSKNSLIAWARQQRNYFQYGTLNPQEGLWTKLQQGAHWAMEKVGASHKQAEMGADSIKGKASSATDSAKDAAEKVKDGVKQSGDQASDVVKTIEVKVEL